MSHFPPSTSFQELLLLKGLGNPLSAEVEVEVVRQMRASFALMGSDNQVQVWHVAYKIFEKYKYTAKSFAELLLW